MMQAVLLMAQEALAVFLAVSCFFRLTKTDGSTRTNVRLAIWFLSVATGFVLAAPVAPILWPMLARWQAWTTPDWVWLLLLLAILLVQVITAKHWRCGVPGHFTNAERGDL